MASAVFTESLARGTARASGEAGESDGAAVTGRARPRSRDRRLVASRRPPMLLRVGGAIHGGEAIPGLPGSCLNLSKAALSRFSARGSSMR